MPFANLLSPERTRNWPYLVGAIGSSITFGDNGKQVTTGAIQNDRLVIR